MEFLTDYISEATLAEGLGSSVSTLRAWRKRGYGPGWTKVGRKVFYRASAVREFLNSQPEVGGAT